jgi:nucleoid-associated protein YgaU
VASRQEPRSTPANIRENSAAPGTERTKSITGTVKSVATLSFPVGAREYTVEAGDTLSVIARNYYGSHLKWEKIYQANKSTMKHPDYIYVGQKIIIPS